MKKLIAILFLLVTLSNAHAQTTGAWSGVASILVNTPSGGGFSTASITLRFHNNTSTTITGADVYNAESNPNWGLGGPEGAPWTFPPGFLQPGGVLTGTLSLPMQGNSGSPNFTPNGNYFSILCRYGDISGGDWYVGVFTVNSTTIDIYANAALAPVSTNSDFCASINNSSGSTEYYGIANQDNGQTFGLDSCGDNIAPIPAGSTVEICTTAAPSNHLSAVMFTQFQFGAVAGNCTGNLYDPNAQGNFVGGPLVGTPIPPGASPGSVSNTNLVGSPFVTNSSVYTNGSPDGGTPIVFNSTNTGLASNGTVIVGFDAVYAELVNVNNSVQKSDLDQSKLLSTINGSVASVNSSVAPLNADLVAINSSIGTGNGALASIQSGIATLGTDFGTANGYLSGIETAVQSAAVSLNGISNFTYSAAGSLQGMSNGIYQIISNTAGMSGSLQELSNYASSSLALTNNVDGGLHPAGWSDGSNVGSLTNNSAYFAETLLTPLNNFGNTAGQVAGDVGTGSAAPLDANFWTLGFDMPGVTGGTTTYTFDLNPMDNAGIAEIAGMVRTCEQWVICVVYIFLVMKIFDQYMDTMAGASQLQLNKTEILGNSVGAASLLAYMPVMLSCLAAVPLMLAGILGSGLMADWFRASAAVPLSGDGHSGVLTQAFWLADQFFPINFCVASCLWYLFIRLTAAPIWTFALVIYKTLAA